MIERALHRSLALANGVGAAIDARSVPPKLRSLVAVAAFHTCLEHHRAICGMVQQNLVGSSLALFRSLYESCLLGLWASHIATEQQLGDFNARRYSPKPGRILSALRKDTSLQQLAYLQKMYEVGHGAFDEYTHGGLSQISHRIKNNSVGSYFPEELTLSLLEFSGVIVAIASSHLADATDDGRECQDLDTTLERFFGGAA